ncbi:GntR family transcriptional regulator [Streptomyces griseosporeus]|uniref:GntR family transcriptional regulator n=1 Tax=Streptomyces griseosporeus TaxID=1910 RepID=UPI0036FB0D78
MMARYEEVAADLRQRIESGEWAPGDTLPTTAELMERYGYSKETVRQAVDVLAKEGRVRVIKRRGTVVQDRSVGRRRIQRSTRVMRDPRRGYVFPAASRPDEPWEVHGQPKRMLASVPESVAEILGVEPGTEVMRRRRVTSPAGEPPFQIADAWIHPDVLAEAPQAGEISTGPGGYLDRIEEAGHGPLEWEESTRVRMPTKEEASLLAIPVEMPVWETTTVGVSARTHRPVEASVRVIPGDRAEFVSKLVRDSSAQWPVEPVQPSA